MSSSREQLRAVFEDTQRFYTENPTLAEAVAFGREHTRLYEAGDYPQLPAQGTRESRQGGSGAPKDPAAHQQRVCLTRERTFEAAIRLHREYPDKKIAVLNFASASRPGGGVKNGASAQEEALCRCSTLYPTLDRRWLWKNFYEVNRAAANVLHTDALIYSPGVVICKTDEDIPRRMDPKDFVTVDVISAAAPNLRREPSNWHNPETGKAVRMDPEQLYALHVRRAEHILHVAAYSQVDILVTGAFGCGAFANDPLTVGQAWNSAVARYRSRFDLINFAIYCREGESENYDAFHRALWTLTEEEQEAASVPGE